MDGKEEAARSITHVSPIDRKSQPAERTVFGKASPVFWLQGPMDTLAQSPLSP